MFNTFQIVSETGELLLSFFCYLQHSLN